MRRVAAATALFNAIALIVQAQSARTAVIAGRVLDDLGDPVIGARVTVERATNAGGFAVVSSAETDDRGEYRVPALPTGNFVVAVATVGGVSIHKTYFPAAVTAANAEAVALQPGDERADVDMLVPAAQSASQPFSVAGGGGGGR